MSRRVLPAWLWAVSLATGLVVVGLRHLPHDPPLDALENTLIDLRFQIRGPRPAPKGVLIVAIDDASLHSIGLMTPMREALAAAIQRLEAAGAASIVIDLLLVEPTPADEKLAEVLSANPSTILAVAAVSGATGSVPPEVRTALQKSAFPIAVGFETKPADPWHLVLPTNQLAIAAGKLGHVNLTLSPDRVARRAPLAVGTTEGMLPSAALLGAIRTYGASPDTLSVERGRGVQLGGLIVATDDAGQVLLNPYGGPRTIETVSLNALLDGQIEPQRIKGRTVFIGASAATLGDFFATPFAPAVAGVEVLATLAANLIDDELIQIGRTVWVETTVLTLGVVALIRARRLDSGLTHRCGGGNRGRVAPRQRHPATSLPWPIRRGCSHGDRRGLAHFRRALALAAEI